jgi:hypothetical protein
MSNNRGGAFPIQRATSRLSGLDPDLLDIAGGDAELPGAILDERAGLITDDDLVFLLRGDHDLDPRRGRSRVGRKDTVSRRPGNLLAHGTT